MTDATDHLLVVGVGASAGGVGALKEFFAGVQGDAGIAYVAILHLSPFHESHLAEVLQTASVIPVVQVQARVRLEADHVYVISPNQRLAMSGEFLEVGPQTRPEDRRAPVDVFFRALADARGAHAACVVLTGTGSDGASGLKRIKEKGGICFAQDPREAQHDDMPRHAIATGLVDSVLPIAEIPARLASYRRALDHVIDGDDQHRLESETRAVREIFSLLRARTGHDFSNYKRATMWRRIERRLAVHELPDLPTYAAYLQEHPPEARALLRDLLISVTNFFRDREVFEALERTVLPRVFAHTSSQDHVRIWVPGCATGEEAYSIALLVAEHISHTAAAPTVQMFATDIDPMAIATAREGLYSAADTAEVSAERLAMFFAKEGDAFRVRKELREMVLFANHNLLKDPPFSHLDLVSCRNLFIYFNRTAQQRAAELLHFALRPGGFVVTGTAESLGEELFTPVENLPAVFTSRDVSARPLTFLPKGLSLLPAKMSEGPGGRTAWPGERFAAADLHQRLLEEYAPPSVVVGDDHDILHLSSSAARYLQFSGGEPSTNLLKAVHAALRLELRALLYEAGQQRRPIQGQAVAVDLEHHTVHVTVHVRPVLGDTQPASGLFLVLFEESPASGPPPAAVQLPTGEAARQLEAELLRLQRHLRTTVEQHEVQSEELKASNEELQAMNEELRSTAEELETSKEELQSLNEELTTVNQELKNTIEEQLQSNNDIRNLIHTTGMAAIFLDRALQIKMFTPPATQLFHLIANDCGRPLSDINSEIDDEDLHRDVAQVMRDLQRLEREVSTRAGRSYLMQVVPYRTHDDRIEGVVLSFVDISERKRFEEELRQSEEQMRLVIGSITEYAILTLDADGLILDWNVGAERIFGYHRDEVRGRSAEMIFTPEDRARGAHLEEMSAARQQGGAADERWHVRKDGTRLFLSGVLSPIGHAPLTGYVKVARDLTERRQQEEALQRAHDLLESRVIQRTAQLAAELNERRQAEERVRKLLSRLITVQEDERHRIARDLHDDLGQKMTALHLKLDALRRATTGAPAAQAQAIEAQAFVQQLDRDLDFFTWELRPAALYDLGLTQALRDFVAQWTKNYEIASAFEAINVGSERWRHDIEINLYRIAQEALNNVYKHSRASNVDVVLQRRGDELVLSVEDNGVGFDPAIQADLAGRGIGLVGMRERAALIGGTLEIERAQSGGTTVIVSAPAAEPHPAPAADAG